MSIVFYRCVMTISSLQNVRVWHNPNYVEMAFCGNGFPWDWSSQLIRGFSRKERLEFKNPLRVNCKKCSIGKISLIGCSRA